MLSMYIVYILNALVIDNNKIQHYSFHSFFTILEMKFYFVKIYIRQTSQWIIMEDHVIKTAFMANIFFGTY